MRSPRALRRVPPACAQEKRGEGGGAGKQVDGGASRAGGSERLSCRPLRTRLAVEYSGLFDNAGAGWGVKKKTRMRWDVYVALTIRCSFPNPARAMDCHQ